MGPKGDTGAIGPKGDTGAAGADAALRGDVTIGGGVDSLVIIDASFLFQVKMAENAQDAVAFTYLIIKIKRIGETRTTATIHGDAQHVRFTAFGFEKQRQLVNSALA